MAGKGPEIAIKTHLCIYFSTVSRNVNEDFDV